jgi:hypothetical protein
VLFDKTHFYLIEVYPRQTCKFTICEWITPGSKTLLQDFPFYLNPWTVLVEEACKEWDLEIVRDTAGSAWLGNGAYGRVFRVRKTGSIKDLALKVVAKDNTKSLSDEKALLRDAAKKCDAVMPIEMNGPNKDLDWAMLMSHVGTPVKPAQYEEVIRLLVQLHQKGILHGDPRRANVVAYNGRLYWIDFMDVKMFSQLPPGVSMVEDMRRLVDSFVDVQYTDLMSAVYRYDVTDAASTDALIEWVSKQTLRI